MNLLRFSVKVKNHYFSPTSAAHTEQAAGLVLIISIPGKAKTEEGTGSPLKLPLQRHMGTPAFSVLLRSAA